MTRVANCWTVKMACSRLLNGSFELRKKNLTLLGTEKKNTSKPLQKLLLFKAGSIEFFHMMHSDTQVSDGKGSKPDITLHYNNTEGGVENLDKMTSTPTYNAYVLWTWNMEYRLQEGLFLEDLVNAELSQK
ncbi:1-(5-phosphoribosyl)-5-[(5-phosphoribosylamino)methylideneamino] imidazole-4-carboxamide isomerase [Trichinella pseudospiralis]